MSIGTKGRSTMRDNVDIPDIIYVIAYVLEFSCVVGLAIAAKHFFGEMWCNFTLTFAYALALLESTLLAKEKLSSKTKNDEKQPKET